MLSLCQEKSRFYYSYWKNRPAFRDGISWSMYVHTLILSRRCDSGSFPTAGRTRIFWALENRSAMDNVIFLCVWLSVECGLNVSLLLNTACPCRPVPKYTLIWYGHRCTRELQVRQQFTTVHQTSLTNTHPHCTLTNICKDTLWIWTAFLIT